LIKRSKLLSIAAPKTLIFFFLNHLHPFSLFF
jgi:hypothetical protein